ncbi:MAG: hypothetical protein AAGB19_01685 [Cyanobacteria bacterium P01_F01_bin.3]
MTLTNYGSGNLPEDDFDMPILGSCTQAIPSVAIASQPKSSSG